MKRYEIHKAASFDELKALPQLEIDYAYPGTPDGITAHAQIGYSDTGILVHLFAEEAVTRAEEFGPLGTPCEDSCMEFFFCPLEGDDRYFNIECNSNASVYLGMGTGLANLMRMIPDNLDNHPIQPKIVKYEGGWEIFYEVSYKFIRQFFPTFEVKAGKQMRANCYKCSDLTEPPHYFSWSPIVGDPFTYHRPECFGTMIFVD